MTGDRVTAKPARGVRRTPSPVPARSPSNGITSPRGLGLRDGHQLVHALIERGWPEPVSTTITVRADRTDTELLVHCALANQYAWALWVALLADGYEVQSRLTHRTPATTRHAIGRLYGIRTTLGVDIPSGEPLLDPSTVRPVPPGSDGTPASATPQRSSADTTPATRPPRAAGVGASTTRKRVTAQPTPAFTTPG